MCRTFSTPDRTDDLCTGCGVFDAACIPSNVTALEDILSNVEDVLGYADEHHQIFFKVAAT